MNHNPRTNGGWSVLELNRLHHACCSRRVILRVGLAAMAGVVLAACGNDDDPEEDELFGATPVGQGPAADTTVRVVLTEWAVEPETTSVSAGTIAFDAVNEGSMEHNLVVIRTDLAADDLPFSDDGSRVDEGASGEVVAEVDTLEPEDTGAVTVDLTPGGYVLICNEPGHYKAGMYVSFTVT